jgi:hypothetical protein
VIFFNPELCFRPNWEKNGMFFVLGTNAVENAIGLQQIFWTEQRMYLLVSRVCPKNFPSKGLAALLIGSALDRVHLQQQARMHQRMLLGLDQDCAEYYKQ